MNCQRRHARSGPVKVARCWGEGGGPKPKLDTTSGLQRQFKMKETRSTPQRRVQLVLLTASQKKPVRSGPVKLAGIMEEFGGRRVSLEENNGKVPNRINPLIHFNLVQKASITFRRIGRARGSIIANGPGDDGPLNPLR